MGARPLARVIQEHVKKPLAEEVLFGKLAKGGTVRILLKDDALTFISWAGMRKKPCRSRLNARRFHGRRRQRARTGRPQARWRAERGSPRPRRTEGPIFQPARHPETT